MEDKFQALVGAHTFSRHLYFHTTNDIVDPLIGLSPLTNHEHALENHKQIRTKTKAFSTMKKWTTKTYTSSQATRGGVIEFYLWMLGFGFMTILVVESHFACFVMVYGVVYL